MKFVNERFFVRYLRMAKEILILVINLVIVIQGGRAFPRLATVEPPDGLEKLASFRSFYY